MTKIELDQLISDFAKINLCGAISAYDSFGKKEIHISLEDFKTHYSKYSKIQCSMDHYRLFIIVDGVTIFALEKFKLDPTVYEVE
jgi:hypothetical protein